MFGEKVGLPRTSVHDLHNNVLSFRPFTSIHPLYNRALYTLVSNLPTTNA